MQSLVQLIKFSLVGVVNNLVYYGVFMALLMSSLHYILCHIAAFMLSVLNAYWLNRHYVFRPESDSWFISLIRTYLAYAFSGLIIGNLLLIFLVERCSLHPAMASLLTLMITVPMNFLLNKFWAFKD